MSYHQEIPNVQETLENIIGRLRLISQYIEYPITELDAAAGILCECANQIEAVTSEMDRANAEIRRQYGCYGKVEVVFHAAI